MVLLYPPTFTSATSGPFDEETFVLDDFLSSSRHLAVQTKDFLEGSLPTREFDQVLRRFPPGTPEYQARIDELIRTPDFKATLLPQLNTRGLMYIGQEEWAVTYPGDLGRTKYLATSDATTCHAIWIRCPETGATGVAHFGCHWPTSMAEMISKVHFLSMWIKTLPLFDPCKPGIRGTPAAAVAAFTAAAEAAAVTEEAAAAAAKTAALHAEAALAQAAAAQNGLSKEEEGKEPSCTSEVADLYAPRPIADVAGSQAKFRAVLQAHNLDRDPSADSPPLDLYLVGGFEDERQLSRRLSHQILSFFNNHQQKFRLQLCCIGAFNTCFRTGPASAASNSYPSPIAYGAAMDIYDGRIFRANYLEKGPDEELRHMKLSFGERENPNTGAHEVYNNLKGHMVFTKFNLNRAYVDNYEVLKIWLNAPPRLFLENFSTSPRVEPPDFVDSAKGAIRQAYELYKEPHETHGLEVQERRWRRQPPDHTWGLY